MTHGHLYDIYQTYKSNTVEVSELKKKCIFWSLTLPTQLQDNVNEGKHGDLIKKLEICVSLYYNYRIKERILHNHEYYLCIVRNIFIYSYIISSYIVEFFVVVNLSLDEP